jgi:hypothetical protein
MTSFNKVPATTLNDILLSHFGDKKADIDFLSLDTEGYEFDILQGLDLNVYGPRYVLIEVYCKDQERIFSHMFCHGYSVHSNFSNYNPSNNPDWDGTHNDYLFVRV